MPTVAEILKNHRLDGIDVYGPFPLVKFQAPETRAAVMLASQAPEAVVEFSSFESNEWKAITPKAEIAWSLWGVGNYRISPSCRPKVTRPWTQISDVPAEAEWFRETSPEREESLWRPTTIFSGGICIPGHGRVTPYYWHELAAKWQWADRNRKTWNPCTTEAPQ